MPYKNVPNELTDEMDRCVQKVMAEGHGKDSAIAICYTSVVEGEDLGVLLDVAKRATEEDYPWDQCIADQKARGYGDERAAKICGAIKARSQGGEHLQGDGRRIEQSRPNDGAMVACFVPPAIATGLAVPGGLSAEDLHLTLISLGDAADFDGPGRRAEIEAVVQAWAGSQRPLGGNISGEIRFPDAGNGIPYCTSFDCAALPAARQELVDQLDEFAHLSPGDAHGFTPHITLAYIEEGEQPQAGGEKRDETCTFGQVSVVWGDGKQVTFPLGDGPLRQIEHLDVTLTKRKTGREWEVTIIGAEDDFSNVKVIGGERCIVSRNGLPYAISGIRESAPFWDGVDVFDNHLTNEEFVERGGMRSPTREWVGTIVTPWWDDKALRLRGIFKMVDDNLATKLRNAEEQGVLRRDRIGLSIDTFPVYDLVRHEGHQVKIAKGFERDRICSVDVVMKPAAGGGFDRLIAATKLTQEVSDMDMNREQLVALIRELISEALAEMKPKEQASGGEVTPEGAAAEVANAAASAAEEAAQEAPPDADAAQVAQVAADAAAAAAQETADEVAAGEVGEAAKAIEAKLRDLETRMKARDCAEMLERKLEAAKLSSQFASIVRAQFGGRVYEEKEIDAMVKSVKEAQAAVDPSGRVIEGGMTRGEFLRAGLDGLEQAQIDLLRLMAGNTQLRALESVEQDYVRERVPEAYNAWIKAGRPRTNVRRLSEWFYDLWGGDPFVDRAREGITTSTVSSLTKNAVNLLLAADYAKKTEWWDPIVNTEEVDTIDDCTLVRVFGLDTLAVVAEGDPYTDQSWVDQEETAAFHKRGNTVSITLETFLKDKLNTIRSLPERLSKSWYNTLSLLVSNVFTINSNVGPTLAGDGTSAALFNATAVSSTGGHANLLTAALSWTAYDAVYTAMMNQTDMVLGAGQKLVDNTPKNLLIPTALRATAYQIRNTEHVPGSGNYQRNPYGPDGDQPNIIVVPNWTDATDWACVADKVAYPAIWLIFLRGRRVPELFTADNEAAGSMFTNDTVRFKVRLMTWRQSSTDNCAPVADWRPLHKSNV